MANTTIQIKRSSNTSAPTTLAPGELAYSYTSNTLFIGNTTSGVIQIALATAYGNAGGSTGGSNTQIQYNNANAFAGSPGFTFTVGSNTVFVGNAITFGTGSGSINTTNYSGTSNNSTYLGGLTSSAFINTGSSFANSTAQDVIISGTYQSLGATLADIGVTAGTYGNTTSIPTITVDTKGRINTISSSVVSIPTGTVNTSGNFTIAGNLVFSSTLDANTTNAAVTFAGGVGIAKSLYANGTSASAYFNNANVGGTLGVVGAATFSNAVSITSTLTANGGTFNGVFANSAGQDIIISGTSSANLAANLVTIQGLTGGTYGNTSAIPTITIDTKGRINAISLSTVSIPTGTVNTSGNFIIAGNLVFNSTLDANTTNAAIIISGGVLLSKSLYANGVDAGAYFNNANIGGTLGVVGAATFSNTIAVTGVATFSNTVSVTGTLTANGGTFNGVFANSAGQDIIISGTSSISLGANLVTIQGLTGGTYGNSSYFPAITVDTKGRITLVTNTLLTAPAIRVVDYATGNSLTMNGDTTDLANTFNTTALTNTFTFNAVTGTPVDGQRLTLRFKSSNVQNFTWNTTVTGAFGGSVDLPLPSKSTGNNKFDYVGFIYSTNALRWHVVSKNFGF